MTTMTEDSERSVRGPRNFARPASGLAIASAVVLADLLTKHLAVARFDEHPLSWFGGAVRLTHSRNSGAAFGVGTSLTPLLTGIAVLAVLALVVALLRVTSGRVAILLGLFLGGVAGNLVDRLFRSPGPMRGHVVDWIDVGGWPTFNLADSSLVIAALGVIWYSSTRETERQQTQ